MIIACLPARQLLECETTMGVAESTEAPAAAQTEEEIAATKLQAVTRGRRARLSNPLSRADAKLNDGSTTMRIKIGRKKTLLTRRAMKLGIELDSDNKVIALEKPASNSGLREGDYILEIDGHELGVKLLVEVLEEHQLTKKSENELRIRRPAV